MQKRLNNRVASSHATLPFMSFVGLATWLVILANDMNLVTSLLCFAVSVYLMVEINNRNALMHTYSRMVSSSFIAMMIASTAICLSPSTMALQTCFIMCYTLLFRSKQQRDATGKQYFAYLFIGIASLIWTPILWLLPLLWFCSAKYLMSINLRSFTATLLGILTPYWFWFASCCLTGDFTPLTSHLQAIMPSDKFIDSIASGNVRNIMTTTDDLSIVSIIMFAVMALVTIISIFNYYRMSRTDKIVVRMLYNMFTFMSIFIGTAIAVSFLFLFDNRNTSDFLLSLYFVNVSPLIAHYFTHASRKMTPFLFLFVIVFITVMTTIGILPLIENIAANGININLNSISLPWTL